jgi:hypothetical protein
MDNALRQLGGLANVLAHSDGHVRHDVYVSLGLRLDYYPEQDRVTATAGEACVLNRVRSGTCPLGTHVLTIDLADSAPCELRTPSGDPELLGCGG